MALKGQIIVEWFPEEGAYVARATTFGAIGWGMTPEAAVREAFLISNELGKHRLPCAVCGEAVERKNLAALAQICNECLLAGGFHAET